MRCLARWHRDDRTPHLTRYAENQPTSLGFRQVVAAVRRAGRVDQKVYGEEIRLIRCPGGVVDLAAQFEGENPEITYSLMGNAR